MMMLVTNGRVSCQARATRATDAPVASATAQRRQHARQALHVDRREVEGGAPRLGGALLVGIELAREEAACERAPREDRDALREAHRCDLALDVAAGDRVVDLCALEPREVVRRGVGEGLGGDPRRQVAEADVARLARARDVVEGADGLLDRRRWVEAVDLVEVDVIEPESAQAGVDAREDVRAG
jgi:hypothetical protein